MTAPLKDPVTGHADYRAHRDPEPPPRRRPGGRRGTGRTARSLPRARARRHRLAHAGDRGHGVPDRVHHQDVHRDRGAAAVRAGARRPRRTRGRLSARLPPDSGEARAPAADGAAAADPHGRPSPARLPRASVPAGPGRDRGLRAARAGACRVLPGPAAPDRGAGHPAHLQQPRVRHARPDRRGRHRAAARPLLPRAHLRAARHDRHRPRSGPIGSAPGSRPGTPCEPAARARCATAIW